MRAYQKGYFKVSDGHRLYFERCGNRKGIPVVFLHGGPGSGFVESHKRCFDFRKFDVLFFDQRGAGRSRPFASLKANTTPKLVSDIVQLLNHFKIKKAIFYGGSWGSTLALVFAIRHPERVSGLVLRGIYLSTQAGMKHYLGGGVANFAPKEWERFVSHVPKNHRQRIVDYYYRQMKSKKASVRRHFAYEWARYELSLVALKVNEKKIDSILGEYSHESLAPIEAHYLRRNCFLPKNFILKNARKLSKIPVSIVHGRYDLLCRPIEAYQLHKRIKGSHLKMACAGHASSDPDIQSNLRKELARVARNLS